VPVWLASLDGSARILLALVLLAAGVAAFPTAIGIWRVAKWAWWTGVILLGTVGGTAVLVFMNSTDDTLILMAQTIGLLAGAGGLGLLTARGREPFRIGPPPRRSEPRKNAREADQGDTAPANPTRGRSKTKSRSNARARNRAAARDGASSPNRRQPPG
jgi:hypothetical protein